MNKVGDYRSFYAVFTGPDGQERRLDCVNFAGPFNAYRLSEKGRLYGVDQLDRSILLGEQNKLAG